MTPINSIQSDASSYRSEARRRAIAHELSAEWHRKWGVRIGLAATAISALVGAAVFTVVVGKLGLDGKGTLSVPHEFWGQLAFYGVFGLSLLSPALSASQVYLDHPGQAGKHASSAAKYYRVKDRLDAFLRKYESGPLVGESQASAQHELDDISKTIEAHRSESLSLTQHAYDKADQQLAALRREG